MVRVHRMGIVAAHQEGRCHSPVVILHRSAQACIDPVKHILQKRGHGTLFRIGTHFLIVEAAVHIHSFLVFCL